MNVNFEAMDLRTEIENIVHEILMEGVTKEDAVKELLFLNSVSNGTSAKDIKMYRKQGRMSGAIKREPFYKLIAKKFDEDYCDYDFTLLYDC